MARLELTIVGMQHRLTRSSLRVMRDRLPLNARLVREKKNEHDENAIMVVANEEPWTMHVGYLTRQVAAELAPRLDSRKLQIVSVLITEVVPHEGTGTVLVKTKRKSGSTKRKIRS